IQRQQGTNRILIELPGVSDVQRVRKLLQGSAKLEFWETHENMQIYPLLENINKIIASPQELKDTTAKAGTAKANSTSGKLANAGSKSAAKGKDSLAINQAEQAKQYPLFAYLAPATYQAENGQQGLRPGPVVGYAAQKDT